MTTSKFTHCVSHILHGLLCAWGLVILVLHVYAESRSEIAHCLLQVRPWWRTQPACSLMLLNCYTSGVAGCASEIERQWSMVDCEMVVRVLIRHCSALEMPPMLQQFPKLSSLKVYNSIIVSWSELAAITNAFHPNLASLFFIRVNLTSGELPVGLLSTDFPAKLVDIEFSVTNLRVLPSDLDSKWPKYGTLYLEKCVFTEIPDVALRLLPVFLSFQGNPIREIPAEVLAVESFYYLHVGDTLVTQLPENVTLRAGSAPLYIVIADTQAARFPSWIDDLEFRLGLFASGSPLCFHEDSSSPPAYELILNASNTNVEMLCDHSGADPVFPVFDEDRRSGLRS